MSTLYKRATPQQHRILRAVEGAVRNAGHAHPEYKIDRRFARSAAKRAAGTLTAQWPEVLAAKPGSNGQPSDKPGRKELSDFGRHRPAHLVMRSGQGAVALVYGRAQLRKLHDEVSSHIRAAKRADNKERVAALVEVCRMIARRAVPLSEPGE